MRCDLLFSMLSVGPLLDELTVRPFFQRYADFVDEWHRVACIAPHVSTTFRLFFHGIRQVVAHIAYYGVHLGKILLLLAHVEFEFRELLFRPFFNRVDMLHDAFLQLDICLASLFYHVRQFGDLDFDIIALFLHILEALYHALV